MENINPEFRDRVCPLCSAPAGEPCQPQPAADHLARLLDAYMGGKLTRATLVAVVSELTVIDESAVIPAPEAHVCPEGTWCFRNREDGEVYAAHPDGTAHIVTPADETRIAEVPPRLEQLLERGLEVSFTKEPEGVVAMVDDHAAGVYTGIADTAAGALEAAVAGLEEW